MYTVIKDFIDLHDNDHRYYVGDAFPRQGVRVSQSRLDALASADNRRGVPLIQKEPEEAGEADE